MPATNKAAPQKRALILEINSLQDALSAVQHHDEINKDFASGDFEGLEMRIAEEVKRYVMDKLAGIFRMKCWFVFTTVPPGSRRHILKAFKRANITKIDPSKIIRGKIRLPGGGDLEPEPAQESAA